jgi:murein peptide amidase A
MFTRRLEACSIVAVLALAGCGGSQAPAGPRSASASRPPVRVRRQVSVVSTMLGHSVRGRAIEAVHIRSPGARRGVLVVGCIHGDEPGGIAIARRLDRERRRGLDLWVIDDLNPDGVAAGTRQNADRVDLNRNFPEHWRPIGQPGDQQYSGPRALSEPESRIAHALIERVRPAVSIWFHQPLGVVDESGGDPGVERRFASLSGLPLRRLTRYPGSAVGWQDQALPGTTAFVVELPPGRLSGRDADRYARAVVGLAG